MTTVVFWLVIGVISVATIFVAHREKMAKLRTKDTNPNPQLLDRIEALEKRCEKLQEQVNEAHMLIHDEQRDLDRKLAAKLDANEAAASESRRKTIGTEVRN